MSVCRLPGERAANMRVAAARPLLSLRVPLARAAASARFIHAPASLRPAPLLSARRLAPPLLAARRLLCTPGSATASELVTTRSGLMYRDVSVPEGGRGPNTGDTVRVHYTGRLEVRILSCEPGARLEPARSAGRDSLFVHTCKKGAPFVRAGRHGLRQLGPARRADLV